MVLVVAGSARAEGVASPIKVTAQWGKGIGFRAHDLFSLQLRTRIQVQAFVATPTEDAISEGAKDEVTSGFLVRRARLVLMGHVFTPKLTYYIQLGFSTRDMEADLLVPLRDAYITWAPLRDLNIRFGQMKVPYGKQRVISSSALQMVDRSIVTAELNLDRDVGLYLMSEDFLGLKGRLMYQAGVFSGAGRNRAPGPNSLLYFGRLQVNPFGQFDHLSEGDPQRLMRPRLAIGVSAAHNLNTNRQLSTWGEVYKGGSRFEYAHFSADLHFKYAGFSLLSEVSYRRGEPESKVGGTTAAPVTDYSRSAIGYVVQAGYVTPRLPFEIVGRWGEIIAQESTDPALKGQREAGVGINYYFYDHSLKIQTDYFHLFGEDPKAVRHQWRMQAQVFF